MYRQLALGILFAIGIDDVVDAPDIESDDIIVFPQVILDVGICQTGLEKLFTVGASFLAEISDDAVFAGLFCFFQVITQVTQRKFKPVRVDQFVFQLCIIKYQRIQIFLFCFARGVY